MPSICCPGTADAESTSCRARSGLNLNKKRKNIYLDVCLAEPNQKNKPTYSYSCFCLKYALLYIPFWIYYILVRNTYNILMLNINNVYIINSLHYILNIEYTVIVYKFPEMIFFSIFFMYNEKSNIALSNLYCTILW